MIDLLKEVGRGKRGARDLTYEEALQAARLIVTEEATPAQIGAFLAAERMKTESAEETLAFVQVLQDRAKRHVMPGSFDSAGPYDGRLHSFYATLPVSFVLAAAGLPAVLHSAPSLPPKRGVTLCDVLAALDLDCSAYPRQAWINASVKSGFLFAPAEAWCPALKRIRPIREQFGLRTVFNTAEKLLRLSGADYLALGVFHATVFDKLGQVIGRLGMKRALIIQGLEGSEDAALHKRTRACLIRDGEAELIVLDPEAYGMDMEAPEEAPWPAERQAETCLAVLQGTADAYSFQQTIFNSAIRLWTGGITGSIEEGIDQAEKLLRDGTAWKTYQAWRGMFD